MMESKWKKTDDSGPSFAVTNKSKLVILYGKIAVYFYDKAGKQLAVHGRQRDSAQDPPVPHLLRQLLRRRDEARGERGAHVLVRARRASSPTGRRPIEAEMQMVGFADASEKKVDFYWRNSDLTPDARPKGGVK